MIDLKISLAGLKAEVKDFYTNLTTVTYSQGNHYRAFRCFIVSLL